MAWSITLPLGMEVSDITIPISTDITYDEITRVATLRNIHVYKVADSIGAGSLYDLKPLCLHENIKKWAAFKPNINGVPTDTWDSTGLSVNSVTKEIDYEKPNLASGYWLEHFGGYNNDAPTPMINIADNYSYTYNGEEVIKSTPENLLVGLPEFDIRNGIRNGVITHCTVKTICKMGDNTNIKETTAHTEITDDDVSYKSIGASFYIYESNDASYEIETEVWFGTTTDYYIFKHPDFPKISLASKQTVYQLYVISDDFDYQADFSLNTVNNTTGEYAFDLIITDSDGFQRGGTARKNVYIDGVLTDIGQANFSASDPITNSGTLPTEYPLPLTGDVHIILNNFSVNAL